MWDWKPSALSFCASATVCYSVQHDCTRSLVLYYFRGKDFQIETQCAEHPLYPCALIHEVYIRLYSSTHSNDARKFRNIVCMTPSSCCFLFSFFYCTSGSPTPHVLFAFLLDLIYDKIHLDHCIETLSISSLQQCCLVAAI